MRSFYGAIDGLRLSGQACVCFIQHPMGYRESKRKAPKRNENEMKRVDTDETVSGDAPAPPLAIDEKARNE
jgi:hypothetical protein